MTANTNGMRWILCFCDWYEPSAKRYHEFGFARTPDTCDCLDVRGMPDRYELFEIMQPFDEFHASPLA